MHTVQDIDTTALLIFPLILQTIIIVQLLTKPEFLCIIISDAIDKYISISEYISQYIREYISEYISNFLVAQRYIIGCLLPYETGK